MIKNPHITVATVIESSGRFLMVEELRDGRQVFNQPAGHVEQDERLLQAALRETLEETAWHVELQDFLGVYVLPVPERDMTYYRFCFSARALHQSERPLDPDIHATHWLSYEEILARRDQLRSPLVLQCIEDYRAGRRLPLDSIHELVPASS